MHEMPDEQRLQLSIKSFKQTKKRIIQKVDTLLLMNKNVLIISTLFIGCMILFSGCADLFQDISLNKTTYASHPTRIRYHVTYGYQINLTGRGESTVIYKENLPTILSGLISNRTIINRLDAQTNIIGDNEIIIWNETFHDNQKIFLGVSADVMAESILTTDLSGSNALQIPEIKNIYPHLVSSYCSSQKNETITFIDPDNPQVKQIANMIRNNSKTNNSFLVAKDLFVWLKTHTTYQVHLIDQHIQPYYETLQKKTGDCDDLSFLYISLCRSLFIPARFIRGYLIDAQQTQMTITPHVWVEVFVGGTIGDDGWIPVECAGVGNINAEVHQNFGVEDAHHLRLYVDDGSNKSLERYTNHISINYTPDITIDLTYLSEISSYTILDSEKLCITDDSLRTYC
jgi:transglutaminase-like putative cysteine protease